MSVVVSLLGGFTLQIDGRSLGEDRFSRRSAAALVKILALTPNRRMHREQVMELLWPHLAMPAAANQLHKAAHYARRAANTPDCIRLHHEMVALFPGRT